MKTKLVASAGGAYTKYSEPQLTLLMMIIFGVGVVTGLLCAAVWWVGQSRPSPQMRAWCRDYRDTQVWARENTPRDALFLVDPVVRHPGVGYGWRDYSRRSSFGNLREWLYAGWSYSSDHAVC